MTKDAFNFSEALLLVLQTGPSCDTGVFLMCSYCAPQVASATNGAIW